MTWEQLRLWVLDTTRSHVELKEASRGLGLPEGGNAFQLKSRLVTHIASQPDLSAPATWSPGVVSVTPPTPPAPTVATASVDPTPPPTSGGATIGLNPQDVLLPSTKACLHCNEQIPASVRFCPNCGKQVASSQTWVCSSCSTKYDSAIRFCPTDGQARPSVVTQTKTTPRTSGGLPDFLDGLLGRPRRS